MLLNNKIFDIHVSQKKKTQTADNTYRVACDLVNTKGTYECFPCENEQNPLHSHSSKGKHSMFTSFGFPIIVCLISTIIKFNSCLSLHVQVCVE